MIKTPIVRNGKQSTIGFNLRFGNAFKDGNALKK